MLTWVAARLLAMGVDRAVVVEATGLTDSELDTLT
jgi:electron transfer flavoprotein alpha/beta subunit